MGQWDIERIKKSIDSAKQAVETEARQTKEAAEAAAKAELEAEKSRKEAIRSQNEARLRATGVVDLFEQLRDRGVVKRDNNPVYESKIRKKLFGEETIKVKVKNYSPAEVSIDNDGQSVSINFNYFSTGRDNGYDFVKAYFEGGLLVIKGDEEIILGKGLNLEDVIVRAVVNPGRVYNEYRDYSR